MTWLGSHLYIVLSSDCCLSRHWRVLRLGIVTQVSPDTRRKCNPILPAYSSTVSGEVIVPRYPTVLLEEGLVRSVYDVGKDFFLERFGEFEPWHTKSPGVDPENQINFDTILFPYPFPCPFLVKLSNFLYC